MKYRTGSPCPDFKEVSQEEFIASIRKLSEQQGEPFTESFKEQLEKIADKKVIHQGNLCVKSFSVTISQMLETTLHIENNETVTIFWTATKKEKRFHYVMIHIIAKNKEEERFFLVDKLAYDIEFSTKAEDNKD